jgi:hypothetical protein
MIKVIDALEKDFSSAMQIQATDQESTFTSVNSHSRQVTFGASPAKPTKITTATLQSALAHATNVGKRGYVTDPMETYSELDIGVDDDE